MYVESSQSSKRALHATEFAIHTIDINRLHYRLLLRTNLPRYLVLSSNKMGPWAALMI